MRMSDLIFNFNGDIENKFKIIELNQIDFS